MTKKFKISVNSVAAVVLVIAVFMVIINAFRAENPPYVKYTAREGTYVISAQAEALVVRDEVIVEPTLTGVMEPSVAEGERVAAYERLGAVITGEINEDTINELNLLDEEIESLSHTVSSAGILSIEDGKVDSTLELSLSNLRYSVAKNDAREAVMLVEDIRVLTERKSGATSSSIAQQRLDELTAKRDRIASSLGGSHRAVYAPKSGLYSDRVDGMEEVLTVDALEKATPDTVDSFFELVGQRVGTGPCKIVNNYKWYILFNLPKEECEDLTIGREYNVHFKDLGEEQVKGTVKYISEPSGDGRCAVTMQFTKHIENLTTMRVTDVEIYKKEYSGIYVPRSAVRVENGVQGVWVQNEVSLIFRSITEVYRSDDFLLVKEKVDTEGSVKNIALYDNIVLNPDK